MKRSTFACTAAIGALALATCMRPGEERASADLDVGRAAGGGVSIEIVDGLAQVRAIVPATAATDGAIDLWSQAPVLDIDITADAAGPWTLTAQNALPDAVLAAPAGVTVEPLPTDRPTIRVFRVVLPAGTSRLRLAPPDADAPGRYRIAAMADIQTAMPSVHEVFARITAEPDVRFVVSMGDITDRARQDEYDLFERQLEFLDVPYYTTLGNHELWADPARYRERYGRASFQFFYRGVAFTFVDSGNAGMDPLVHDWLDEWLARGRDHVHLFLTHFPLIDPLGIRAGSFRSRREAHRVLARLAEGNVDLTLYGHIHSYYAFDNAGIPAYISGGGGADPERWDGIDRHFLLIDLDPEAGRVASVGVARVD